MVGEACLPSNAYYPRTPDYTLCSGVHVCWSEHSDSSFVYGFMILDYGFGTMTATTYCNKSTFLSVIPTRTVIVRRSLFPVSFTEATNMCYNFAKEAIWDGNGNPLGAAIVKLIAFAMYICVVLFLNCRPLFLFL